MNPLPQWQRFTETGGANLLDEILSDEVSFHSPVVWTPQKGKFLTKMYLMAAAHIFKEGGFVYSKKIINGNMACLEFETKIGNVTVNGADIITWDGEGKITEFKVMVRPIKAVNAVWEKMAEMLEKLK
ncbi:MAG TPA: nuclear transport factor 2 family protein [Bacteroidetes bacterium]|nr:nuclear transport factor 2 family protein [Bacteroidota bacterium]